MRIAGVNVGKVTTVQNRGVNSLVTMDIQRQYAPLPKDTQAILRQKTLLGEAYVMLSTGTATGPKFADGATIPTSQIQDTQQLDQVLGSFDTPTQKNLQALLQGTFTAIGGRGQDLNDTIGNLDPTVQELTAVVGVLNDQQQNLQSLINNTGTVLSTLGNHSADLTSLITAGDQVFATTAARNASLTATVNALPPFLTQLRSTLPVLDTTLGIAQPTLATLRPVARLLPPALAETIALAEPATSLLAQAPGLFNAAETALPSITRFSNALGPALDAVLPAAREITPVINFLGLYSGELQAAMSNLGASLQAVAPANTTSDATGAPVGTAHYLRAVVPINDESVFGQSVREPSNRHNAYYSPGEQNNLATGLLSSDCNNTSNPRQVPLLTGSGNVPCKVQPAFNWGSNAPTNPLSYYPHLTRAPVPKQGGRTRAARARPTS